MAWTVPKTDFNPGDVLTAAQVNAIGENLLTIGGNWTNFTPTLSGGWALGNSTYEAKYIRAGKLVVFYAAITIGSSATKGTTMYAALPVTAASVNSTIGVTSYFNDVGSGIFPAHVVLNTTSIVELTTVVTNQTYAQVTGVQATVPFTWATGDAIYYAGTYEGA